MPGARVRAGQASLNADALRREQVSVSSYGRATTPAGARANAARFPGRNFDPYDCGLFARFWNNAGGLRFRSKPGFARFLEHRCNDTFKRRAAIFCAQGFCGI
jgi:hypothetical protein